MRPRRRTRTGPARSSATGASAAASCFGGYVRPTDRPSIAAISVSSVSSALEPVRTTWPSRRIVIGVGELENLVQEVRDEDDRPAACGEATDDLVEPLDLGRGKRGGRFVEHDELGVPRERPQDLDLLLLRERQRADRRVGRDLEPGVRDDALEPLEEHPPADKAESSGSAPRNTFSATVRCGTTATSWATRAMPRSRASRGDRKLTGSPFRMSSPSSGGNTPATILPSVDLPAPFSPTKA